MMVLPGPTKAAVRKIEVKILRRKKSALSLSKGKGRCRKKREREEKKQRKNSKQGARIRSSSERIPKREEWCRIPSGEASSGSMIWMVKKSAQERGKHLDFVLRPGREPLSAGPLDKKRDKSKSPKKRGKGNDAQHEEFDKLKDLDK